MTRYGFAVCACVCVAYSILAKCTREQLQSVYAIPPFKTGDEFLMLVAKKRGKLGKGGVPNLVEAARLVIQVCAGGMCCRSSIHLLTLSPVFSCHVL